jgi:peroxiredoxin
VELRLEPFEPDLGKRPPIQGRNDLSKLLGKSAPKFQCTDWFNSTPLDLDKLKGKVVVLTMWGGFDDSPFSTNRMNQLRALYDLYNGVADDVAIVAVHDAGSDANEVAEYVKRFDLRFPVGKDADPFVSFVNYGINFIPQTVLIDKKGVLQYDQVEGRLLELVKSLRLKGEG